MEQDGAFVQAMREAVIRVAERLTMSGIPNEICGNLRRGRPWMRSGIVVAETETEVVHKIFSDLAPNTIPQKPNTTRIYVDGLCIHIYAASEDNFGAATIYYTGPVAFRKCLCSDANSQGLSFSVSGLWHGKQRIAGKTEQQIFDCLGLEYTPPGERRAYTTRRAERKKKLRANSINERKAVFRAILTIFANRQRGALPVSRSEIDREIGASWLTERALNAILTWMQRHGIVTQAHGGGWLANRLPDSGICWVHGKALPCYICRKKKAREDAQVVAAQNREIKRKVKEANDVVLGICGSGN